MRGRAASGAWRGLALQAERGAAGRGVSPCQSPSRLAGCCRACCQPVTSPLSPSAYLPAAPPPFSPQPRLCSAPFLRCFFIFQSLVVRRAGRAVTGCAGQGMFGSDQVHVNPAQRPRASGCGREGGGGGQRAHGPCPGFASEGRTPR